VDTIAQPAAEIALASPPTVPLGFMLARLGEVATGLYRESLKETGLKPPHIAALRALRAEPISQQTLGETIEMDPVKLVGILNDLEAGTLIERRRDTIDRRRHIVDITSRGRSVLETVERAADAIEERLFAGLSPAQRDQLVVLMQLIMETSQVAGACPDSETAAASCPGGSNDDESPLGRCESA
jgi:DNA-binding MarR family transcriptional regulator